MNLQQFLLILRARWWVVFAVLALALAAAGIASLVMPRQYTASAALVVDIKGIDPVMGSVLPIQLMPGYMATQQDIVKSDRVAQRVVRALGLDKSQAYREAWQRATEGRGSFEAWLGALLAKELDVQPSRDSSVINIEFTWPEGKAAAAIANAFAKAYIETHLELRVEPAKEYAAWFEERSAAQRATLEAAQKRLSDYQRENGIVGIDERLDVENSRLNELSSQLVGVQSLRADTQSRFRQTESRRDILPEVIQNPLIAGLKSDLARQESKREETATRLGANHPEIQRLDNEIAGLRERVKEEINRVAGSIGSSNNVNIARESEVRGALEAQKKRILALKQQRDQMTVLQADVTNAQRAADVLNQRLAQTSLESQTQQTNIVVLNPATEPLKPSSPNVLLYMLAATFLGTLLGLVAAVMLELFDRRVRTAHDVTSLLGLPILGALPRRARSGLAWPRKFAFNS